MLRYVDLNDAYVKQIRRTRELEDKIRELEARSLENENYKLTQEINRLHAVLKPFVSAIGYVKVDRYDPWELVYLRWPCRRAVPETHIRVDAFQEALLSLKAVNKDG